MLAIFVISVTLGAQNDQQVTFNYLLAQGSTVFPHCWRYCLLRGLLSVRSICGLFWLRVRVSLARAERKIKRLENQLSPATDVAVAPHSSAAKE
ncbi:LapA family protein [Escherichia coli]